MRLIAWLIARTASSPRVVDDSKITENNPRYRLPGERKHDGKIFEFIKTLFLYNGFRIQKPVDDPIVIEGFTGVWWLVQNELGRTVSTMGAQCSEKQAELIVSLVKPSGTVWIISDGNAAGERFALELLRQILPRFDIISTSHIDRTHLNLRLFNRRLTRLTLGFSKSWNTSSIRSRFLLLTTIFTALTNRFRAKHRRWRQD